MRTSVGADTSTSQDTDNRLGQVTVRECHLVQRVRGGSSGSEQTQILGLGQSGATVPTLSRAICQVAEQWHEHEQQKYREREAGGEWEGRDGSRYQDHAETTDLGPAQEPPR